MAKRPLPSCRVVRVLSVRGDVFANGRGRWFAAATSLVVSAALLYAQDPRSTCCADAAATPAAAQVPVPEAAPTPARVAASDLLQAGAPMAVQDFRFALPAGVAPERGMQTNTIWAARAISVMFPEVATIGGYRQDPLKWHPNGLAIDVMIPNYGSKEGIELGNQIAGLALANAERWGVIHVVWRQGFYPGVGAPSWTADYGSETANHYDHVHIATNGGGYPTGRETYYLDSIRRG
jgi:hypothetical protein